MFFPDSTQQVTLPCCFSVIGLLGHLGVLVANIVFLRHLHVLLGC